MHYVRGVFDRTDRNRNNRIDVHNFTAMGLHDKTRTRHLSLFWRGNKKIEEDEENRDVRWPAKTISTEFSIEPIFGLKSSAEVGYGHSTRVCGNNNNK